MLILDYIVMIIFGVLTNFIDLIIFFSKIDLIIGVSIGLSTIDRYWHFIFL